MSTGAQPASSGGGGASTAATRFQNATQMGGQSISNLQALLQSAAQVFLCMICIHAMRLHACTLTPTNAHKCTHHAHPCTRGMP